MTSKHVKMAEPEVVFGHSEEKKIYIHMLKSGCKPSTYSGNRDTCC